MPRQIDGELVGTGLRVAVAATRFNAHVVDALVAGAVDCLVRHGVADDDVLVVRCPGAWELPLVCQRLARAGRHDAVVALGCVIRGQTPHFEHVAAACATGVARVALECDLPVSFGVLTADSVEQALDRAGLKLGNKGADAALAAIETCRALGKL